MSFPLTHAMTPSTFRERPTKEQIALLPPFPGLSLGQISVLTSPPEFEHAYRALQKERFVGFDTETKPTFTRGAEATGPHVIQLALREQAFIVQLGRETPRSFLEDVLESQAIVKVGFGLKSDRGSLLRSLGIRVGALVELTETLRTLRYKHALGAKAAVAIVLGQRLQKSKSVTTSNWASATLQPSQLLYAANDAYAALRVFLALGSPYTPAGSTPPDASIGSASSDELRAPAAASHVDPPSCKR